MQKLKIAFLFSVIFLYMETEAISAPLKLCLEEWQPYYVNQDSEGNLTGIDVDTAAEVSRRLGMELTLTIVPYLRCQNEVLAGRKDGQFHVVANEAGLITGQHSILPWVIAPFVKVSAPYETTVQLAQKESIIWLKDKDYEYPDIIETMFNLVPFETSINHDIPGQPFRIIASGNADVYFEDYLWGTYMLEQNGLPVKALLPVVVSEDIFVGFTPTKTDLAQRWDQTLGEMLKDGTINTIVQKWTNRNYADLLSDLSGE